MYIPQVALLEEAAAPRLEASIAATLKKIEYSYLAFPT
jgi:hypothetical protein